MASICKNPASFDLNLKRQKFEQGKPVEPKWLPAVKTLCRENQIGKKLCKNDYSVVDIC